MHLPIFIHLTGNGFTAVMEQRRQLDQAAQRAVGDHLTGVMLIQLPAETPQFGHGRA